MGNDHMDLYEGLKKNVDDTDAYLVEVSRLSLKISKAMKCLPEPVRVDLHHPIYHSGFVGLVGNFHKSLCKLDKIVDAAGRGRLLEELDTILEDKQQRLRVIQGGKRVKTM